MDSNVNQEMDRIVNQEMDKVINQYMDRIVNQKMHRIVNQELDVDKVYNQDKSRLRVIKGSIPYWQVKCIHRVLNAAHSINYCEEIRLSLLKHTEEVVGAPMTLSIASSSPKLSVSLLVLLHCILLASFLRHPTSRTRRNK